jgi:hypothetical protein
VTGTDARRVALVAGDAAALLAVTGALAWTAGLPALFPSLGPSAFVLALAAVRADRDPTARAVVGGHAVGVLAGLAAYHLLAGGATVTALPPARSTALARLALAACVSVGLTTAGMLALETVHAPACATTLIVSLGILPAPRSGAVILVSVGLLYLVHRGTARVRGA